MTWLIVIGSIVGGIAALLILVMIIGRFLPEHYHCKVETALSRPPEEVWSQLMDFRKHPLTGSMAKRVEDRPSTNGLPVWLEDMGSSKVTVTTIESKPPMRLVREMVDSVVPMTARSVVDLTRTESGCQATASHDVWVRNGTWHVPIF